MLLQTCVNINLNNQTIQSLLKYLLFVFLASGMFLLANCKADRSIQNINWNQYRHAIALTSN